MLYERKLELTERALDKAEEVIESLGGALKILGKLNCTVPRYIELQLQEKYLEVANQVGALGELRKQLKDGKQ